MSECKCSLSRKLTGDGCRHCNPQFLIDHLAEHRDELQATCDELAEALGVMTTLCRLKYGNLDADVYAEIQKAEVALARYRGE